MIYFSPQIDLHDSPIFVNALTHSKHNNNNHMKKYLINCFHPQCLVSISSKLIDINILLPIWWCDYFITEMVSKNTAEKRSIDDVLIQYTPHCQHSCLPFPSSTRHQMEKQKHVEPRDMHSFCLYMNTNSDTSQHDWHHVAAAQAESAHKQWPNGWKEKHRKSKGVSRFENPSTDTIFASARTHTIQVVFVFLTVFFFLYCFVLASNQK